MQHAGATIQKLIEDAEARRAAPQKTPDVAPERIDIFARFMARNGFFPCRESAASYRHLARYLAGHVAGVNTRGLLLFGLPGRGKTMFLRLLRARFAPNALWSHSLRLVAEYQERGIAAVMAQIERDDYDWTPDGYRHLVIDDVGREPIGKRYGETLDVIPAIIDARYEAWQRHGYAAATWITANIDRATLMERYDSRTTSRLMQMCAWAELRGPDWRASAASRGMKN